MIENTSGQEELTIANENVPVSVLATPVLDWFTLYCQHGGTMNPLTLPFSAKAPESASTSTSTFYMLTRRLKPSDMYGAVDSATGTTSATSATAIWTHRFFLDENLVSDLLLAGGCRMRVSLTLLSNSASYTSTLDTIVMSIKKLTAADTYTTIATGTISPAWTNATTTAVQKSFMVSTVVSPEAIVTPSEKLCFEIATTGHTSNGSGVCTVGILFTTGTSASYCELGV